VDTWQQRSVGGAVYHLQAPDGCPYDQVPTTPAMAQARLIERFIPLAEALPLSHIPPLMLHPDTPMTLDLRLANQR
jgi:uncharacterized protein (DUF2126 family)